jgi:hypothetical protein
MTELLDQLSYFQCHEINSATWSCVFTSWPRIQCIKHDVFEHMLDDIVNRWEVCGRNLP